MKKTFVTLMIGAMMCGCTSSINDETINPVTQTEAEGNTVFRFSTSAISVTATRSAEDSYVSEQGTESEWKINKVRVYLFDTQTKQIAKTFLLSDLTRATDTANGYITYTSNHVMLSQGTYDVFAVANSNAVLSATTEDEFINNVDAETYKIGQIVDTSNGLLMTNRASANLATEIKGFDDKKQDNVVEITMERVVARLDVARSADSYSMKDENGDVYATIALNDFHYVNLPNSYYTFRHTAILTSMTEPVWNINENFGNVVDVNGYVVDPYFFNKKIDATTFQNEDAYYVNYFANYFKGENVKWTNFKAASTTPNYNTCYSLENCSMQAAQKNGYSTGVVFRGVLTPNNSIYILNATTNELELLPATADKPATLYYYNHRFYNTVAALAKVGVTVTDAMSDEELEYSNVKKFRLEDDKYYTYYTYWVKHLDNNNPIVMGVMEFGVVRNNLYRMLVTKISDLGSGDYPINPDIPDEGEAYLKVELNVKPWIVREQKNIVL